MAQSHKERLIEIDITMRALQDERADIERKTSDLPWPRCATIYLHGSKESNYENGEGLGLNEEALRNFVYACYEVGIDIEVNEDGTSRIVGVDGRKLQPEA